MMDRRRHAMAGVSCPAHVRGSGRLYVRRLLVPVLGLRGVDPDILGALTDVSRMRCGRSGSVGPRAACRRRDRGADRRIRRRRLVPCDDEHKGISGGLVRRCSGRLWRLTASLVRRSRRRRPPQESTPDSLWPVSTCIRWLRMGRCTLFVEQEWIKSFSKRRSDMLLALGVIVVMIGLGVSVPPAPICDGVRVMLQLHDDNTSIAFDPAALCAHSMFYRARTRFYSGVPGGGLHGPFPISKCCANDLYTVRSYLEANPKSNANVSEWWNGIALAEFKPLRTLLSCANYLDIPLLNEHVLKELAKIMLRAAPFLITIAGRY